LKVFKTIAMEPPTITGSANVNQIDDDATGYYLHLSGGL
jgi:hypothetical protein